MINRDVAAGVMFDFCHFLTTSDTLVTTSMHLNPQSLMEQLKRFMERRGLDGATPDNNWEATIAAMEDDLK